MTQLLIYISGILTGAILLLIIFRYRFSYLKRKASYDELTGLLNYSVLRKMVKKFNRISKIKTYSLILIDLDDFKKINDTMGYDTGDKAIKWFAGFLNANFRHNDLIFRYKLGDEFAILIQANMVQAEEIASRLLKQLQKLHPEEVLIKGFCFGIAQLNGSDLVMKNAENQLITAKTVKKRNKREIQNSNPVATLKVEYFVN